MSALYVSQNGHVLKVTTEADGSIVVACAAHPVRHRGWKRYRTVEEFARFGGSSMRCYRCDREHAESVQQTSSAA